MPDVDELKEGKNYYTNTPQKAEGFFLKGSNSLEWGMKDRLAADCRQTGFTALLGRDDGADGIKR